VGPIPGRVKSNTEKLAITASLVHHLRPRIGLMVGLASVYSDWVGFQVYLRHDTSMCWNIKTRLVSGPVTADLTTTVVHSYQLLINDVKSVHSITHISLSSLFLSK